VYGTDTPECGCVLLYSSDCTPSPTRWVQAPLIASLIIAAAVPGILPIQPGSHRSTSSVEAVVPYISLLRHDRRWRLRLYVLANCPDRHLIVFCWPRGLELVLPTNGKGRDRKDWRGGMEFTQFTCQTARTSYRCSSSNALPPPLAPIYHLTETLDPSIPPLGQRAPPQRGRGFSRAREKGSAPELAG
jgi:hypothetical protein